MWRVPGERVTLDLDGPTVEVERLSAWVVMFECLQLYERFNAASKPEAEYDALTNLYDRFVVEAQPTWDISDHRGVVPNTARGMTRLPTSLALAMVSQWMATFAVSAEEQETAVAPRPDIPGLRLVESQAPSAVDAVVPPGPLNREIKRRLRAAKKKAA